MKKKTMKVSEEFLDQLKNLGEDNETYEDTIKRLIGGTSIKVNDIFEVPVFTLNSYSYENESVNIINKLNVSWSELCRSVVGQEFSDENNVGFSDTATIIYRDDDCILVKFFNFSGKIHFECFHPLNFSN